eukprot:2348312-Pleurochrysis_carterae.AAC.1
MTASKGADLFDDEWGNVTLVGAGEDANTLKVGILTGETKIRPSLKLRVLTEAELAAHDESDEEEIRYPIIRGLCRWEYRGSELPGLDELMDKEQEKAMRWQVASIGT